MGKINTQIQNFLKIKYFFSLYFQVFSKEITKDGNTIKIVVVQLLSHVLSHN